MNASTAIVYVGFLTLIGFAVYFTGSSLPLWALLLFPGQTGNKVKILSRVEESKDV